MTNIIHFISDDKFTTMIVNEFQILDGKVNNHYIIPIKGHINNYKFIDPKISQYIKQIKVWNINSYIRKNKIDIVILHNLYSLHFINILLLPSNIKIVWFAWGKDLYCLPEDKPFIEMELYGEETRKFIKPEYKPILKAIKSKITGYFYRKAIQRVDYFSGVLPKEYTLMKQVEGFKAKELDFSYATVSKDPELKINRERVTGKNILVGNSGDETNNHLDIFKCLSQYELGETLVYVPISYAGSKEYREKVIRVGKKLWSDRFIPLETFMPLEEYNKIISSCGIRIFAHERQQAVGNISSALALGCKVFLSETSMAYDFYKRNDLRVFSLQKDLTYENITTLLPNEDVLHNMDTFINKRNPYYFYKKLVILVETIEADIIDK